MDMFLHKEVSKWLPSSPYTEWPWTDSQGHCKVHINIY